MAGSVRSARPEHIGPILKRVMTKIEARHLKLIAKTFPGTKLQDPDTGRWRKLKANPTTA